MINRDADAPDCRCGEGECPYHCQCPVARLPDPETPPCLMACLNCGRPADHEWGHPDSFGRARCRCGARVKVGRLEQVDEEVTA